MKRVRLLLTLACALIATAAAAQNLSYVPPAARTYAAGPGETLAPAAATPAAVVTQFLRARGIVVPEGALVQAGDPIAARNNVRVVRFEERAGGVAVYAVYAKASFNARGGLIHLIENLVPVAAPASAPRVSAAQALAAALERHYGSAVTLPPQARSDGNAVVFARTPFFHDEPSVTRVAVPMPDGTLQGGLLVETWSEQQNLLHHTLVGAAGDVLRVELRTSNDQYNVFAVDPSKSVQTVVTGPTSTTQSPAGWLGTGTQTTVNISGNNAHSYLDADGNNRPDRGGTSVTNGEFLTAWTSTAAPSTTSNREVAVQNLFYLNNVIHDTLYTHGFTELTGNFQQDNFGRGGAGKDPVNAEAQDGSGTDNANFATPSDGRSPRMQMYLWSNPAPDHEVVVNGTSYGAKKAEFGPALTTTGVSGTMVLVNDGVGTPSDGCEPMSSLSGLVALIDRGTCSFKTKVANAQSAGAVAVVVANNQGGTAIIVMGDDSAVHTRIRIPAVMVDQNDGATLKGVLGEAGADATVRKLAVTPLMTDASLDSDVVFHEYGHGLTWRMIGGMSGPLAGAIGEGASDGVALLVNGDDVVGEYSSGNPNGIRRAPYSGYPLTYGDVTGAEVHNDGEVFAAIVWKLMDLFQQAGVSRETLFNYYVDGMNFTAATPAWENMRDGMLQSAANASDAAGSCLIWKGFAQFGVGVGATGVANADGTVTIHESFTLPAACQ